MTGARLSLQYCPGCGGREMKPSWRGLFSKDIRMECPCGVAGKWRRLAGGDAWDTAAEGWAAAFGYPSSIYRPKEPKK